MKRHLIAPAVVAAVAALFAVACFSPPTNVASRYVKSVAVDKEMGAVITVTAEESPELAGTVLAIDPGALPQNTTITLEVGDEAIVTGEALPAGPVAIFGPPGLVFQTPARMTLPTALATGQTESGLFIQVQEETGETSQIPRELLEVAANTASFRVSGFTAFQPGSKGNAPADAGNNADAGPPTCNSNAQCGSGQVCLSGACHPCTGGACPQCVSNSDCAPGQFCANGRCWAQSDGGNALDAGTGTPDAGTTSCNPLAPNCPSGEYCYFDEASSSATCAANTGTQGVGQACGSPTDCLDMSGGAVKALHCQGFAALRVGTCREYCGLNSQPFCAPAQTCTQITSGSGGIGYCAP